MTSLVFYESLSFSKQLRKIDKSAVLLFNFRVDEMWKREAKREKSFVQKFMKHLAKE